MVVGCAACLALGWTTTPSTGAEAAPQRGEGTPIGMKLKASHGYSLQIYGFDNSREGEGKGPPGSRDEVLMMATRPGSAVYYVSERGEVTEGSIKVDFGDVGEVDVTYRPSGRIHSQKSACQSKPFRFDSGSYEGRIEFHGEEGYAEASATRARGDMQFLLDVVCSSGFGEAAGPGLPGASLRARSRGQALPHLEVEAIQNRPGARVHIGASMVERTAGLVVLRGVFGKAPAKAFGFDPRLRSARLDPPPPFSGRGIFHRNADNPWSGNLSVDFPGHSDVSLAGPGTLAGLRHAAFTRETIHPED